MVNRDKSIAPDSMFPVSRWTVVVGRQLLGSHIKAKAKRAAPWRASVRRTEWHVTAIWSWKQ